MVFSKVGSKWRLSPNFASQLLDGFADGWHVVIVFNFTKGGTPKGSASLGETDCQRALPHPRSALAAWDVSPPVGALVSGELQAP